MAHQVNLDALIPREDFDVLDRGTPATQNDRIQITNLAHGDFFYGCLRKPDFQRETSDWSPEKICGFVESFLEGDLIPALILWQAGTQIFVIDGAHRLSALIAWVQDDYGNGPNSRKFFDGVIPPEQDAAAEFTRRLVKKRVRSYADHRAAIQDPGTSDVVTLERAKRLGTIGLQLQWVKGDAKKAEDSFFKINQQASPIDKTELRLLKARRHANALAARAIVRSGTGHKYWSHFPAERQSEIEAQAKAINELLFSPNLKTPIKTLDLPVAGRGYSSQVLPLVFEFVNLANDVKKDTALQNDVTGEETLWYLKTCRRVVNRMTGTHPSSLGLHPAVYFYSHNGRYQPTAFMAVISLLGALDKAGRFRDFIKVRRRFEDFLLRHRILVNQVTVKYGSGPKGYARLEQLLAWLMDQLLDEKTEESVIQAMQTHVAFSFLQPAERQSTEVGPNFGTDVKSEIYLRDALKDPVRCRICEGLIHSNGISIDHVKRKADGGMGEAENGQLTHPYCNTTIKN